MSFKSFAIGAAVLVGLPVAVGAYSTFSSVMTAPSRVINKTLETDNILFNYEYFFDMNAAYTSRLAQVKQFKAMFSEETDKDEKIRLRTEMTAMQQSCRDLVTEYNANSEKLNRGLFKDKNLPYELNISECE